MLKVFHIISTVFGWTGSLFLKPTFYLFNLTTFSFYVLVDWKKHNKLFDRNSYKNVVSQMIFTGIDALPAITLLAFIVGFLFTFRLISIVDSVGGTEDLVDILVKVIGLGIAPLISAFILISRTGSAIVVYIGNMKLHGEIQSLELLAVNINNFLIAPELISCAISQLALTVYFTIITMIGGILLSSFIISEDHLQLLSLLPQAITPSLLAAFVVKNLLYGFIIASTACYHGLSVMKSLTEMPQQTQKAIINSLVIIFLIDALLGLALLT
jgi:phospholipid/cholesterol/gamma-HCH transport system permease protein